LGNKIVSLIPTCGDSVVEAVESCLNVEVDVLVVFHNCHINKEIFSLDNVFCIQSFGANLSEALNDGLSWIYNNGNYEWIVRLDATSIIDSVLFYKTRLMFDDEYIILNSKKTGLAISNRFVFLNFLIDNPFSHSGLVLPVGLNQKYDTNFFRAQDFELYLRNIDRIKIGKTFTKRFKINRSSASFLDRSGQLRASQNALTKHKSSFPVWFYFFSLLFREIKILMK